jgi:hypothetical protein
MTCQRPSLENYQEGSATSARVWLSISPGKKSYQHQSLEKYLTLKEVLAAPEFGTASHLEGSPFSARFWKSI